jgi:hypothetical protein
MESQSPTIASGIPILEMNALAAPSQHTIYFASRRTNNGIGWVGNCPLATTTADVGFLVILTLCIDRIKITHLYLHGTLVEEKNIFVTNKK